MKDGQHSLGFSLVHAHLFSVKLQQSEVRRSEIAPVAAGIVAEVVNFALVLKKTLAGFCVDVALSIQFCTVYLLAAVIGARF